VNGAVARSPETPRDEAGVGQPKGQVDELRAALDAAIVEHRWDAVAAIHARIQEVARDD
jgi:hypothetical protein